MQPLPFRLPTVVLLGQGAPPSTKWAPAAKSQPASLLWGGCPCSQSMNVISDTLSVEVECFLNTQTGEICVHQKQRIFLTRGVGQLQSTASFRKSAHSLTHRLGFPASAAALGRGNRDCVPQSLGRVAVWPFTQSLSLSKKVVSYTCLHRIR